MVAPGDQHEVTIPHMVQGALCHRPTESLPPEHSTQPRSGRNFAVDTGMGAVGARPSLCTNYRETLKGREFAGKRKPVGTAAGRVRSLTRKNKTLRVEKPPEIWNAYKGERELLARIFFSKKCSSLKKHFIDSTSISGTTWSFSDGNRTATHRKHWGRHSGWGALASTGRGPPPSSRRGPEGPPVLAMGQVTARGRFPEM